MNVQVALRRSAALALLAALPAFAQQNTPAQAPYVAPVIGGAVVSASNPVPVSAGAASKSGISSNGSVGTVSATIIPAGTYSSWVTIQNTHATQKLSLSFSATATPADMTLAPGAAVTLPYGLANALNGIGSGAGTTFALIGF